VAGAAEAKARHHGLDAARGVAMIFVVGAHAAMSFMETPIGWAVRDVYRHLGVDLAVWIVRGFVMPAFFWLSGYFARAVYEHGGPRGFVRHRLTRVVVPLGIAMAPCSLALDALWAWGRAVDGRPAVAANIPKLLGSDLPVSLGHLWYLYYLLAMSAVAVVVVSAAQRLRAGAASPRDDGAASLRGAGAASPRDGADSAGGGAALLAVIAAAVVAVLASARTLHLDTPLTFAIEPRVFAYMGAFFVWGWQVHARPGELDRYARHAWRAAIAALLLLGAVAPALHAGADPAHTEPPPLYAIAASGLFSIALVAAFLGLALRYARRPSPVLRLASESSYWFYVAHLPLVVLLQVVLAHAAVPGPLKYATIVAATTTACLATYELAIRRTRLRRILG
jgi:glucans biosynthesis protein C